MSSSRPGPGPVGRIGLFVAVVLAMLATRAAVAADGGPEPDASKTEFFETTIRPLLAERCQGCHGPSKQKGGLRLDSRTAILAGGHSGPVVVPGDPDSSPIIDAVNYGDDVRMPPKSKLPAAEIAALTRWVEMGAPWGRGVAGGRD